MSRARSRYSIDLAAQQAECEANYARLLQLLPDMAEVDHRDFAIPMPGDTQARRFRLSVTERCKYTTMLELSQLPADSTLPWQGGAADFSLRVYHDARMAEVVSYNHHRNLRASYDYPNRGMYQRDEKIQLNRFLGEWLSHCLTHGHSLEDPLVRAC